MLDLPATTMTNNLLARHLCVVVVMCVHAATKRIVPILLGAPLLRASDFCMHSTLSVARPRGGSSICARPGAGLCACVVSDT